MDYVVKGEMIGGFALVAWPAEYGVSGVNTFIVSHHGMVYEKDLGPTTSVLGAPDDALQSWHRLEKGNWRINVRMLLISL